MPAAATANQAQLAANTGATEALLNAPIAAAQPGANLLQIWPGLGSLWACFAPGTVDTAMPAVNTAAAK